jgi:hypothetical protein
MESKYFDLDFFSRVVRSFRFACAPIALVLSVWSAGCSSSSGVSADQACGDNAHAICMKMQSCAPANLQATYGDELTCETRAKATCLDVVAAPSTGASPAKTEACAKAYANYACFDYRNKANIPADCQQATGFVASGSACEYPGQCQSGFCAIVPGNSCGKCADAPKQGDSCASLTSCGPSLTCTSDTLVCTTPAAQMATCGTGQPCGAGLSCVAPAGAGTAGTCQTAGSQAGASCDGTLKTGAGCDNPMSLYCDGLTKQCAQTAYVGAAQACGYDSSNGTLVECTAGTCVGAAPTTGQLGQCVGRAADNGACNVPDGGAATPSAGCLPSARCISSSGATGTCQTVSASGCH